MAEPRWERQKEVFQAALERAPSERPAYLATACGDDLELRGEVASLLAAREAAGGFLSHLALAGEDALGPDRGTATAPVPTMPSEIGGFRIVSPLGQGGMGVVFLAEDPVLLRPVALKLLSEQLASSPEASARFLREARTMALVEHPGVVRVYSAGEHAGRFFLAMEYVRGETLSQLLAREGRLPVERALSLAREVALGLEAAWSHGIVHRDVKPSNILIDRTGRTRVADFGLAKTVDAPRELTRDGRVPGTPAYMSPEHVRGETLDQRSDIYSLGLVLYEMLTGRSPFAGTSPYEIISRQLNAPLPSLTTARPDVALPVAALVGAMTEKARDERPSTYRDLVSRIASAAAGEPTARPPVEHRGTRLTRARRIAVAGVLAFSLALVIVGLSFLRGRLGGTARGPISSLAVLPLANHSGDADQDYLADGLTEALIADLAKIRALKVISRTSVMHYKGASKTLPEIARELGVDAVVEGSVARAGNRVRVTAQLVDGSSDRHLWAETYDRDVGDILATQSEVARAVAAAIKVQVTPQEQARLARRQNVPAEAYEAYLRGRYAWNKRTEEDLKRAIVHFQRAIDLDPGYALAYSGMADAYFYRGYGFGTMAPRDAMPKAREAAQKALALDPDLGEAYTSLAVVLYFFDWRFGEAEEAIERSIALSPNYPFAHHVKAAFLWTRYQRGDEAMAEARRALELDPLSVPINNFACLISNGIQRAQQTEQLARALIELNPNYSRGHAWLGHAYEQLRRPDEAFAEYLKLEALFKMDERTLADLTAAYKAGGLEAFRRKDSELSIEAARRAPPLEDWLVFELAADYAGLGRKDEAFRLLERAYEARSGEMVWIKVGGEFSVMRPDPLSALRSDPRFADLLRRVGLPAGNH